jgi:transcriptional regulator with XRE-family HTH domain
MITCNQIRAARALIGWKQADLAAASGVSEISIKNIERGVTNPRSSTLDAIQKAFLAAGVVFLAAGDTPDGGVGIRLTKEATVASIPIEDLYGFRLTDSRQRDSFGRVERPATWRGNS